MSTTLADFEIWAAKTALAPYIDFIKSEIKKTLKMAGIDVKSLNEDFHKLMKGKDLLVQMIQDASEYGFDQTFGPYLQLTGNIFKKSRDYLNPKNVIKGDNPVMQQIAELTKAGVPVTVTIEDIIKNTKDTMPRDFMTHPYAQGLVTNPYMKSMMRYPYANNPMAELLGHSGGGKREKEPAEEIEETFNMLINHRLWVLDQAKKKGNKSKAKSKKRTIKKKKMIKNPKKKGTKRRKGSKRR
jgi:hypothetical protein